MKGFYFGAYNQPGLVNVTVDFHNINMGVNQPDLRPVFRAHAALSVPVNLAFDNTRHTDFVAYIGAPLRLRGPGVIGTGNGYEVVIFRRRRGSDELISIEDEDLSDVNTLGRILAE